MLLPQIEQWAQKFPNHLVHQLREQCLTYSELQTYSDAWAVWLWHKAQEVGGIKLPVVVYGHKESEMLVLFLACVKAGHPYIPIDISVPSERLKKIRESSKALAILSPRDIPDMVKTSGVLCEEQIRLSNQPSVAPLGMKPQPEWSVGLDDVWYIIFTSGSTGEPKGVQITQRALESFVNWVYKEYKPEPIREVFLNQAPFSFDLSVMDLYMALCNGGTLWSVDQEQIAKPKELFQSFKESQVSYWVSTPSFAEFCLMDSTFTENLLPQLRYFLFCGEILPNDVAARLLDRFPQAQVINLYGPTESTVAVTGVKITSVMAKNYKALPVGQNLTNCRIYICDPEELDVFMTEENSSGENSQFPKTLFPGEKGEIVIVGSNVSIGYLNRPELSRRVFFLWQEGGSIIKQAYRTGDLGYWHNGKLFYLGRRDFQVKLHGYRIELGEIEEQLRCLSEVENAVVLPVVRRGKNAALQAFIKLNNTQELTDLGHYFRGKLSKVLPAYMLPQRYICVSNLPLTANGKVDRQALLGGKYDSI